MSMNLDLSLRTLFLVTEAMPRPRTFLFDTFFANRENLDTETVTIEFKNGRRLMAPFVDRYVDGEEMPKDTFSGRTFKPYAVAPKKTFHADELTFERLPGENPFSQSDPDTKRQKKIAETLQEQSEQIARRWEAMAAETLYKLQTTIDGEGISDTIKYYDNSSTEHHTTVASTWDNANSDPIKDIKAVLSEINKAGGTRPEAIILDPLAAELFINNKAVQNMMNLRNAYFGDIRPEVEGVNGASYVGTLTGLGIDVFEYQEYYDYVDKSTKQTKTKAIIPDYTALFAPEGNLVKFGAVSTIKDGLLEGDLIPRTYTKEENDTITILTMSKPVTIPLNTKSLKVLKVK